MCAGRRRTTSADGSEGEMTGVILLANHACNEGNDDHDKVRLDVDHYHQTNRKQDWVCTSVSQRDG